MSIVDIRVITTTLAPDPIGPYPAGSRVERRGYCSGQQSLDSRTGELVEHPPKAACNVSSRASRQFSRRAAQASTSSSRQRSTYQLAEAIETANPASLGGAAVDPLMNGIDHLTVLRKRSVPNGS